MGFWDLGLSWLSWGGVSPTGTQAGHGHAAGAVPRCWASPPGRASSGIAFSSCLFRFKINLTFSCSGLCKHSARP